MTSGGLVDASSGDEWDQRLRQQAQEAQQSPPQSPQRQLALSRLIKDVLRSGKLGRPQHGAWASDFYEDLYHESLQRTLLNVCQKIDSYNPEHAVMAWVNFRLNYEIIEVINDFRKKGLTQLPATKQTNRFTYIPSLDTLDHLTAIDETLSDNQLLHQFLEEDPENLMQKRLRDRPDITFQYLALAKFVEDRTWLEISTCLEISVQTLCSFFNRQLKQLIPYFHKYLTD